MKAIDLLDHFGIKPYGIIHVGANDGGECAAYAAATRDVCVYVEPIPDVLARLEKNISRFPGHVAVQALCTATDGEIVTFNVSSNGGQSSSILPLGEHATIFPDITYVNSFQMVGCTLDRLIADRFPDVDFTLLVIDVQGAELLVLQGATTFLQNIDAVFLEINETELYQGCCTFDDVQAFFKPLGFRLKWMEILRNGFGDAFFLRKRAIPPAPGENIALGKPATQSSQSVWSRPNDAQGGNNGSKTGTFGFHTNLEAAPWWQVDLLQKRHVTQIRLFNRLDMCAERAGSLVIKVSEDGRQWVTIHEQRNRLFGGTDGRPLIVPVNAAAARFVRIQLTEPGFLHLDEVEVYAA